MGGGTLGAPCAPATYRKLPYPTKVDRSLANSFCNRRRLPCVAFASRASHPHPSEVLLTCARIDVYRAAADHGTRGHVAEW